MEDEDKSRVTSGGLRVHSPPTKTDLSHTKHVVVPPCASTPELDDHRSGNNGMEGVEVDCAFLMSLLEESHCEGNDEERLNSLIQSLQAEINPVSTQEPESASEEEEEDSQLGSPDRLGSLCSTTPDMDFNWIDMEMVTSSPSDDMNWYMDTCVDGIGSMDDLCDVTDYAEICNGVEFEDSLWQETYDTVMFQ